MKKGTYRHYKAKLYEVIDIARHSETLEEMVVYRPLLAASGYDPDTTKNGEQTLWVRPLSMFTENVVIDGKSVPRFVFVSE